MKKVTELFSNGVEMREYYVLNGKEYDTLADVVKVIRHGDAVQSRRTVYGNGGETDSLLNEQGYSSTWRTYACSSLVDMGLTLQSATADDANGLPLAERYAGLLSDLVFRK